MNRRPVSAAANAAGRQTGSAYKQVAVSALALMLMSCAALPFGDTMDAPTAEAKAKAENTGTINKPPADLDGAIAQAVASRKSGDFAGSARTLSQLVIFEPDEPRVLGEYGKTLAAMGRSDDALAFLERAIQLLPMDWSLVSAQGVAFDQKGNYPAAEASYLRALAIKPGEPTVLNNAALSRMQAGDLDGAERLLLQAAPGTTENPRIAENLALVQNLKQARTQNTNAPAAPVVPPPQIAQAQTPAEAPSSAPATAALPEQSNGPAVAPSTVAIDPLSAPAPSAPKSGPTVVMAALPEASQVEASARTNTARSNISGAPQHVAEKSTTRAVPAKTEKVAMAAPARGPIYVQAGAYASENRAGELAASLDKLGARVSPLTKDGRAIYRVRIGPFLNVEQANSAITQAHALGHADVKIVSD